MNSCQSDIPWRHTKIRVVNQFCILFFIITCAIKPNIWKIQLYNHLFQIFPTLSISYYDLGHATGEMAAEILTEGADISTMEVRFAPAFTKEYNADICEALNITVPEDYVAIAK